MRKHALKFALFTLAAALALAGCAQSGASSAAPSVAASSAPEASAPSQSAAPKPESTPAPSSGIIEVSPDAGQTWPPDEPFDPFPDGPPALPDGTLTSVTQADMDTLLTGKNHASWMYRMADTNLVYQYRFFPDGFFSASLGKFETDSGVYGHGTCRFLQDGLLEAMVWLPEDGHQPGEDDYRENASPVYLTLQLQWPGEGREQLVATLLTLEDTSPGGLMEQYFRPAVGVPLPMDLYAD